MHLGRLPVELTPILRFLQQSPFDVNELETVRALINKSQTAHGVPMSWDLIQIQPKLA